MSVFPAMDPEFSQGSGAGQVRAIGQLLFVLVGLTSFLAPAAGSDFREAFEGDSTSWKIAGSDCPLRIELHQRTRQHGRRASRSEHIRIRAGAGTYVYATHPVDPASVISELRPSVWMRADRSGLQFMARVVLPRSQDPRSGRPLSTFIRGASYTQVGSWQRLEIGDPQTLLGRQVPVLRAQFGPQIDPREAYIDLLAINIYGGLGVTSVWIDDLEVDNQVAAPRAIGTEAGGPHLSAPSRAAKSTVTSSRSTPDSSRVRLQGSILTIDRKPFFPRAIEYQGESFQRLAELGFNAVKLTTPATHDQYQQAARHGLWLIAPVGDLSPPHGAGLIDKHVLAWDLGRGLGATQVDAIGTRVATIRKTISGSTPLVCSADSALYAYSRYADFLVHERRPLGTSFEMADYGAWLTGRSQLARPGTPFWAMIQNEPNAALTRGRQLDGGGGQGPLYVEPEQIRMLTFLAVINGSSGICFPSHHRLDGNGPATRLRGLALERLNRELALIEPWIAERAATWSVDTDDPTVRAAALVTKRSRLVIPIRVPTGAQYAAGTSSDRPCSITVAGVPESSRAFELTAAGLEPLRHRRVAGGTQITVNRLRSAALVVLTGDAVVIKSLTQRLASTAKRQTALRRALAAASLGAVEQTERHLGRTAPAHAQVTSLVQGARANLSQCDQLLAAGDHSTASHYADRCLEALGILRRTRWQQAVESLPAPITNPFAGHYASLPMHWTLAEQIKTSTAGASVLPHGDFEDLGQMVRSGWRHFQHELPDVQSNVSLTPEGAKQGSFALSMRAVSTERASAGPIESVPVWITSAPVRIQAGQIVRIVGWVRVDARINSSLDGLMIYDSLGGPLLAERIRQTRGWQQITFYRKAAGPHPLTVTFALTGLGHVLLDDFSIEPLRGQARMSKK